MFGNLLKTRNVSFPYTLTTFDEAVIKETQREEKCSREEALARIFAVGMYIHVENLNREKHLDALVCYHELQRKDNARAEEWRRKTEEVRPTETQQTSTSTESVIAQRTDACPPQPKQPTDTPAPSKRGGYRSSPPVTVRGIPSSHLRFSLPPTGHVRKESIRFSKKDSENLHKSGYRWYKCEYFPSSVKVSLYRDNQKANLMFKKANMGGYFLLSFPHDETIKRMASSLGVSFSKDKVADIPYSMTEGRECLILNIRRPINDSPTY